MPSSTPVPYALPFVSERLNERAASTPSFRSENAEISREHLFRKRGFRDAFRESRSPELANQFTKRMAVSEHRAVPGVLHLVQIHHLWGRIGRHATSRRAPVGDRDGGRYAEKKVGWFNVISC